MDPAAYIGLLFLLITIQAFMCMIGRYSLELDWWRAAPFAFILLYIPPVVALSGFTFSGVFACFLMSSIFVWMMAGFFYEPDLRQCIAMSAVLPIFGMVALPLGYYLRRAIFSY